MICSSSSSWFLVASLPQAVSSRQKRPWEVALRSTTETSRWKLKLERKQMPSRRRPSKRIRESLQKEKKIAQNRTKITIYICIRNIRKPPKNDPKHTKKLDFLSSKTSKPPPAILRHGQAPSAAPLSPEEEKERKRAEILCFAEKGVVFSFQCVFLFCLGWGCGKVHSSLLIGFLFLGFGSKCRPS